METKLHTAVRYGNEEKVLQALKEGLDPNQLGDYKWSPVHEAAHNGERDILKLLILFHGDVNLVDRLHGNTPLHYAAQEDNSACVTALLVAGASVNVKNDEGFTPMDIATSSCKERMDIFFNSQNATGTEEWKSGQRAPGVEIGTEGKGVQNPQEAWEGIEDVPSNAAIGHLHLSFEFHKSNLKVRVWQVSDLLLPPPQTSMIESIFVRSYFIPDSAKKSNRKTEVVRIDSSSKDISKTPHSPGNSGIQHIFTPSSFRFDSPLIYTGVTKDIVSERSVQIEVCMTQKHTHKAFLIAMVHLPLRTAVRRPIRQKYPLIPCMNYTIPNNMRVYSARDVFVEEGQLYQHQNSVGYSRSNSSHSNPDSNNIPDIPLDSVESSVPTRRYLTVDINSDSESFEDKDRSNEEFDDDDDDDDDVDDGIGSSVDVKICSGKERIAPSHVNLDMIEYGDDQSDHSPDQLTEIISQQIPGRGQSSTTIVNIPANDSSPQGREPSQKKRIIPNEIFINTPKNSPPPSDPLPVPSSVVEIEEEVKSTIIDITQLQKDFVLDLDSESSNNHDNNENCKKSLSPEESQKNRGGASEDSSKKKKKRIIPFESDMKQNRAGEEGEKVSDNETNGRNKVDLKHSTSDINSSEKRIPTVITTQPSADIDEEDNEDDEVAQEIQSSGLQSSSSELSPHSKDQQRSTPTGSSRPETPIWDYYDFACDEEAGGGDGGDEANGGDGEASSAASPPTSPTEKAPKSTSTLQDSLARLSRPQATLDTCRVAGPVLPSITLDDFEMDDD